MNFAAFARDIEENQWNVHGVEAYKDGQLLHSWGDTRTTRFPIYSATKTITSIATGLARDEEKFDLEKSILEYLPRKYVEEMMPQQLAAFRDIAVERLLTMSVAGFPFRPEGESFLRYSLACPIENVQERTFDYSNISAYLVGVAVTEAVGEDLVSYLNRKLFEPLHITPICGRCPDGYFYGASNMEMTVHELSQVGLLLYHGGVYEGKRILSEEYVKLATSVRQMNREGGYGYFIWKYRDGFSINGKWKQKCYVLPKQGLMVTYLADIRDDSHELLESMERNILEE